MPHCITKDQSKQSYLKSILRLCGGLTTRKCSWRMPSLYAAPQSSKTFGFIARLFAAASPLTAVAELRNRQPQPSLRFVMVRWPAIGLRIRNDAF